MTSPGCKFSSLHILCASSHLELADNESIKFLCIVVAEIAIVTEEATRVRSEFEL